MSDDSLTFHPSGPLRGRIRVPGDKSVSHRALLLNLLADGPARIRNLLAGEDVLSTMAAVRALGAQVVQDGDDWIVHPPAALQEPGDVLDCGNSGTTMRLLSGILAAQPFFSVLTGDDSLRARPMARIVEPLRAHGAMVLGRREGARAPLAIRGGGLQPIGADLPVASAQLKSALLLAGLQVGARVREPGRSRDHTERMLQRMGVQLSQDDQGWWNLTPHEGPLQALDVDVPGDLSSAAFWLVAGAIVPGSDLELAGVGINPTRTGVLDALQKMGAPVQCTPIDAAGAEPQADLRIRSCALQGCTIDGDLALRCLDELPVLAIAAAFAEGTTRIRDAAELRVKESDRIATVASGLRSMGIEVHEVDDGMDIVGGMPAGPVIIEAGGDHRIAMAFAVAGLRAPGSVRIEGAHSVATSYPAFLDHLKALGGM